MDEAARFSGDFSSNSWGLMHLGTAAFSTVSRREKKSHDWPVSLRKRIENSNVSILLMEFNSNSSTKSTAIFQEVQKPKVGSVWMVELMRLHDVDGYNFMDCFKELRSRFHKFNLGTLQRSHERCKPDSLMHFQ